MLTAHKAQFLSCLIAYMHAIMPINQSKNKDALLSYINTFLNEIYFLQFPFDPTNQNFCKQMHTINF